MDHDSRQSLDHDEEVTEERDEKTPLHSLETRLLVAKKIIASLREELANVERLLDAETDEVNVDALLSQARSSSDAISPFLDSRVMEGVFDGQNMVGSDGRQYIVPQNYASKSKLVEGDLLKLTIQSNGSFIFKQIGPIERERLVGVLIRDEQTQEWRVAAAGRKFSVLPASVSYYKGEEGDDAVILIPKAAPSRWAAVENIVHKE